MPACYRLLLTVLGCLAALPALAHSPLSGGGQEQVAAGLSVLLLLIMAVVYGVGSIRRRPSAGAALCFTPALLLTLLAVVGPLDHWAETSAAWHMVQHMLFMVVIAPLWVFAQPLPQLVAGIGHWLLRFWQPWLKLAGHPMQVAYLHAGVVWFWHTPYFYRLALAHPWWHVIEHGLFLGTAGLFWWAVLRSPHRRIGWALLALLFTLMHTGFLGALLTFARTPLYGDARGLADQQLAGLIMWVPGELPYMLAAGWAAYRSSLRARLLSR